MVKLYIINIENNLADSKWYIYKEGILQYLQNLTVLGINSPNNPNTPIPTTKDKYASLVAPLMVLKASPQEKHL